MKVTHKRKSTSKNSLYIILLNNTTKQVGTDTLPEEINAAVKTTLAETPLQKLANKQFSVLSDKKVQYILLVDTNQDKQKINFEHLGGTASESIQSTKADNVSVNILDSKLTSQETQLFVRGLLLGNYKFDHFISDKKKKQHQPKQIEVICEKKQCSQEGLNDIVTLSKTMYYVRDLVNTPPNFMNPKQLTKEAKAIARLASKQLKIKVFGEKELKKHKMGLILGVGSGSLQESQMIFMEYKNKPKNTKPIIIAGKGITFDAGGLNIKPTNFIEDMKSDMAGAASVLGLMKILALTKPNVHVIGVIAAAENMLGADAMRPGDILTAYNGKTVEITNTDAEGRLVLADALAYITSKEDPVLVIDLATLTGACIAALGYEYTGYVTNRGELVKVVDKASQRSNNQFWPLPLSQNFKNKVNNTISDYKNWTAGVNAGASMGGAFLEKFVNDKPWIHCDIAGSSWTPHKTPIANIGATGEPIPFLWELIKQYC